MKESGGEGKKRPGPRVYFGEKGWRLVRSWQTLMIVAEAEKPLTVAEVNERLAVDSDLREFEGKLNTTRDDLWTLVRCGFPIRLLDDKNEDVDLEEYLEQEESRRGQLKNTRWAMKSGGEIGLIEGTRHRRPSSSELTSLSLLRSLLRDNVPPSYPLYDQLRVLLDELHRWLVVHLRSSDRTEMVERFIRTGRRYLKRGPGSEVLIRVGEALQRHILVEGSYCFSEEKHTIIKVLPLAAWFTNGRGHMLGARGFDGALRVYRLDRFESMSACAKEELPHYDEKEADELLLGSFGGFIVKPDEVKFIANEKVAYLFDEYQFHPSQKINQRKDGSIAVTLKCAVGWPLEEWLLGYGEYIEVIAPKDLRERIRDRHLAASKVYYT